MSNVAEEASALVHGPRQAVYGSPPDNLRRIALAWSGVLGVRVTPLQVALCMAAVKLVREGSTPGHRDNLTDTCGYMLMAEMVAAESVRPTRVVTSVKRWMKRMRLTRRS